VRTSGDGAEQWSAVTGKKQCGRRERDTIFIYTIFSTLKTTLYLYYFFIKTAYNSVKILKYVILQFYMTGYLVYFTRMSVSKVTKEKLPDYVYMTS
jgi:heptaprenylglyceryl phosphate synthase